MVLTTVRAWRAANDESCPVSARSFDAGIAFPAAELRANVIRPALGELGLWSPAAEDLVLGTAAVEGALALGGASATNALGLWRIDSATHDQLWSATLDREPGMRKRLGRVAAPTPDLERQLVTNLAYAAAICRLIYWRHPEALPRVRNVDALGRLWLAAYRQDGAGSIDLWCRAWRERGCSG